MVGGVVLYLILPSVLPHLHQRERHVGRGDDVRAQAGRDGVQLCHARQL